MTAATATTASPHGGHDLPVARPMWWLGRKEERQVTRSARTIRAGPPM
jgi:hypothetical protein